MSMKKKIIWFLVSCLMALSLVIASCGPAEEKEAKVEKEEKPQYGGTLSFFLPSDVSNWDAGAVPRNGSGYLWYENLMQYDWAKGPAGSGEQTFVGGYTGLDGLGGCLAESWELLDPTTWVFKIRKGVHWAHDPDNEASQLMNGREFTPEDVIYNYHRQMTSSQATFPLYQPELCASTTVEKTGPWEVTIKTGFDPMATFMWLAFGSGSMWIRPPEVIEEYGDVLDWHNVVGTGPYILVDYVSGSYINTVRNSNYWEKETVGPGKGDQLPYADEVKLLIIPDISTRLAALRSGQVDWIADVSLDDMLSLKENLPDLLTCEYTSQVPNSIGMRTDKADLPFSDKRVRQALMMGIDYQSWKEDYYQGKAEIINWPLTPNQKDAWLPLEKLPANVRELFEYNPDRAKQLLAEANYPDGFDTTIICLSGSTELDIVQILQNMWQKINVNLEIQPMEAGSHSSIWTERSHEEMIMTTGAMTFGTYLAGASWRGPGRNNTSYINDPPGSDPIVEAAYEEIMKYSIINMPKADQVMRETLAPYLMENAFMIPVPSPYIYTVWRSWLKNYHGEMGNAPTLFNPYFVKHIWIDQDLKEEITGR
jgi:peptide/nickel transport system substrate-binding protein